MRNWSVKINLVALAAFLPLVLAGCAVVGSSNVFDENAEFVGCRSTLGSYSLSRRVLHIVVTKGDGYHILKTLEEETIPDNRHVFCLDHLRSPTASDEVRVLKNKIKATQNGTAGRTESIEPESTPYLQLIASKSVDHTAGIIRRFIRAAFILLTNRGGFGRSGVGVSGAETIVADFHVDPFDYVEMAVVNQAVRRFGFCFILENYTFDRSERNAANDADHYCNAPNSTVKKTPPKTAHAIQSLRYLVPKPANGIFFRPRAAYRLTVYLKADPEGRGVWRPGMMKNVEFENIMPIVSVGVDRAIFATRRTGLVFDDGMLTNVCISKGSEAEGAIQIPLDVIYGIISLPSETIRGAVEDATTARDLLQARNNLAAAQTNYIKFLNGEKYDENLLKAGGGGAKGKLTLLTPTSPNFQTELDTEFGPPPDAGQLKLQTPDALAQICKELFGRTKTSTGGDF